MRRHQEARIKGKIVCGKFIDRERPSYLDIYNGRMGEKFGPSYNLMRGVMSATEIKFGDSAGRESSWLGSLSGVLPAFITINSPPSHKASGPKRAEAPAAPR